MMYLCALVFTNSLSNVHEVFDKPGKRSGKESCSKSYAWDVVDGNTLLSVGSKLEGKGERGEVLEGGEELVNHAN